METSMNDRITFMCLCKITSAGVCKYKTTMTLKLNSCERKFNRKHLTDTIILNSINELQLFLLLCNVFCHKQPTELRVGLHIKYILLSYLSFCCHFKLVNITQ